MEAARGAERAARGRAAAAALFAGAGEVRALGRTLDWGATPLGWPDAWSPALRLTTRAMLDAPFPVCLWSGPEYALVYNDAYRRILAAKHPAALGQPGSVVWAEIWSELAPQFAQVWAGGPPVYGEDARFVMARLEGGGTEDAWFSYSLSALRDEDGAVAAVLNISPETTARVHAEQALAAERARLRGVILQAPVPMALHEGPEHRYVLVNDAYRRVSGGRDVTGLTLRAAFPEVAGQGLYEVFDRVYATGEAWAGPETPLRYDRRGLGVEDTWYNLRYEPVRDAGGRVTGVLNFSVDVTDQVRARRDVERLLAESEAARAALTARDARYQALLASLDTGFCVIEVLVDDAGRAVDFRYLETNATFERQSGLSGVVGRRVREFVPDLEARWLAIYGRVAATGAPERVADYSAAFARWFDVFVYRVDDPALRRVAVLFTDVTPARAAARERERLVRALEVERARLAAVFAQTPSVLAIVRGPDHVLDMANAAYLALNGHRDVLGKPLLEAVPELRGQGFEALLDAVVATGEPYVGREVPIWLSTAPGAPAEERFFDFVYLPLVEADPADPADPADAADAADGGPRRVGVIAHGNDVTAQVRARREVERLLAESERARADAEAAGRAEAAARREAEQARAEAEAANRAKAEFLAVMSHELRTPLNAIGGYAELLEMGIRGPVTAQQREDLGRIQRSQRHLLGLVNEVLNYAKLETGSVHYDTADVRACDALAAAEALVAPQARAKGLVLAAPRCSEDVAVRADPDKLRQVLVNLLSNAVKFTERGGRVELTCEEAGVGGPSPVVRFAVRDTGIGIAADQLARIFDPFVQVRSDLTRTAEGAGLGLAISRDLARGMGGDLTAESTPGVGSTFTLTLPAA